MENIQIDTVSSTVVGGDTGTPGVCSRNVFYRERSVKTVDIVYTDIFLDVTNYDRDKRLFIERILGFPGESEDSDDSETLGDERTNVTIVCSKAIFDYISGAERAAGRDFSNGPVTRSKDVDVFVCDMTMAIVPDRIDTLVTFNIDPFEACAIVGNSDNCAEFRRTFKRFVSAKSQERSSVVTLVFSMFLLNERALETFIAVNNVAITSSDIRFVFVHDNTEEIVVRDIVCNYCTDLMLCLNRDMRSFVVDGAMPPSVDFALSSNPLYLVILRSKLDAIRASPENEYFRFKQFYHTFAYGKQSKWGIEVDGGNDPSGDRSYYIRSLNEALQLELVRLFRFLRRAARQKYENELKYHKRRDSPQPHFLSYDDSGEMLDYEESKEMIEAREKLFKAYYSCPILMNAVDIRSIMTLGNDERKTLLKRDQHRLLESLRHAADDGRVSAVSYPLESQTKIYDTMTYPLGGNVSDSNVLEVLFADEIAVSSCFVVGKNQHIKYNRFLSDLLYSNAIEHLR